MQLNKESQKMNAEEYFHSANQLKQEGKLDTAIDAYRLAINLKPEWHQPYHSLGEMFDKQGESETAIANYEKAIELNPNFSWSYLKLANILTEKGLLDEAVLNYKKTIELNPNLSWSYFSLADILTQKGSLDEAVKYYRNGIQVHSNRDSLSVYYIKLGELLAKQKKLDQEIATCKEALKLQSNNLELYQTLAIYQAQNGEIEAAVNTYKKAFDLDPENAGKFRQTLVNLLHQCQDIYLHIWNIIDKSNLDIFEQDNLCYPTNIHQGAVMKYFTQTSQYKVIELNSLTPEDRLFLENQKISLEKLKLINIKDNAKQQEQYLQSFNCYSKILPQNPKNNWYVFQEAMVDTGYIYLICPISGRILRSNQSFVLYGQIFIYRFVGEQVFYLITHNPDSRKYLIYFPNIELIILLGPAPRGPEPTELVNKWKSLAVTDWQKVIANINHKGKKEIVLTHGWMGSTAHHFLNDLTGIQGLLQTGRLEKVDKFLVGPFEYYGQLEIIFPEIPADKIIRFSDTNCMNTPLVPKLIELVLEKHYFALKAGKNFITEDLANRVYQMALKKCTPSFLNQVEAAKSHFPLLFITIRTHNRTWISQVAGIANIINQLLPDFPNLGVVFDGISFLDKDGEKLIPNEREKAMLESNQSLLKEIVKLLPKNFVNLYDSIGCLMCESIVWAKTADCYISPFGGGLAKLTYIANKPGIIHTNHYFSRNPGWYNDKQRENGIAPTYLNSNFIVESSASSTQPLNYSYDFDWTILYDEILKQIKT